MFAPRSRLPKSSAVFAVVPLLAALALGCGGAAAPPAAGLDPKEAALLVDRPYEVREPANLDAKSPRPLLLLLHGYSANGVVQKIYFGLDSLVDATGLLLAYPDGTTDKAGHQFWNATDACCAQLGTPVDDVAYLRAVIHDMKLRYNIDSKRVFVLGHSNGAFMAYRLACDLADEVSAIAGLAGATWQDPGRCHPSGSVSVLHIHGDADATVLYNGDSGGPGLGAYPSAHQSVASWAQLDGCSGTLKDSGSRLDLVVNLAGAETRVERYDGCPSAGVELWTIQGGSHLPELTSAWGPSIYDFLKAHPKP